MKCPVDGNDLLMTARQGVEIDYCPKCRGIWLDRGELDKIIDRAGAEAAPEPYSPPRPATPPREYREPYYREDQRYDPRHYKKRKKKNLLREIFDFD